MSARPNFARTLFRPVLLIALTGLVLAGCSSLNPFADKAPAPACPDVRLVENLNRMAQYRDGPGRDLTDVVIEARFGEMSGACSYDRDAVIVDLLLSIEVARGPGNTDRKAKFDYFVAITDPADRILTKQVFPVEIEFERTQNRQRFIDELTQRIPLADLKQGPNHRILLGFQIREDQLEENLRRPQR